MELNLEVIGHIGKDATVKELSDKSVINFSVAHTEKYTGGDGVQRERTTWVECSMWDREKMAQYLKKGTLIKAAGVPSAGAYVPKDGGDPVGTLRLNVFRVLLLSSSNGSGSSNSNGSAAAAPANAGQIEGNAGGTADGMPF